MCAHPLAALGLDRVAAPPADGPGDAAAMLQMLVGGIDDGVDMRLRDVAVEDHNGAAIG